MLLPVAARGNQMYCVSLCTTWTMQPAIAASPAVPNLGTAAVWEGGLRGPEGVGAAVVPQAIRGAGQGGRYEPGVRQLRL